MLGEQVRADDGDLDAVDVRNRAVVTGRYPDAERLMAVCARSHDASERIIERAQHAGALCSDFTGEDLLFIFATNTRLAQAAHPLPAAPLTAQQLYEIMGNLSGTP
ncbi:hypothetical protein AB0D11_22560 [Streptomyces monashensis]|uniref:hypothetical protein n=1 Tax=Streptomyces monashensis TaxID=1678012 RepID=UPI0033FF734C